MKIMRWLVTSLSTAAIAVCCGVWLLFGASTFGWKALDVPTGSMRPTLPIGSLVLVHQVPASTLRVGDIITYQNPVDNRGTITHRIVEVYLIDGRIPGFVTKGDANTVRDVPISGGSVQGEVAWHVPYLGNVISWAKTWVGIAVLVYTPALLISIEELMRLSDYYRLTLPYRLASYHRRIIGESGLPKLLAVPGAALVIIISLVVAWQPIAAALMQSNTVSLVANHITVGNPAAGCHSLNNDTNVSINSNSSQTASAGSATTTGSTTGGSATSGSASNSNSTNVNVTISNGC